MVELHGWSWCFLPAMQKTVVLKTAMAKESLVGVESLHAREGSDGGVIEVGNGLGRPLSTGDLVVALLQSLRAFSAVDSIGYGCKQPIRLAHLRHGRVQCSLSDWPT